MDTFLKRLQGFFLRGFNFIRRYYKRPLFLMLYAFYYFNPLFKANAKFFSEQELIKILKEGKSFIRFGDGEVHLMKGQSLPWQKYEKDLERGMRKIIQEYNKNSPYIVGIPKFTNLTNKKLREDGKLNVWLPAKVMFKLIFPKNVLYGDPHVFYYDGFFEKYMEEYFLDKHIILGTNIDNITSIKNNTKVPFKNISFVVTPKTNAYSNYKEIYKNIENILASLPEKESPVILMCAGPASKVLVYEFSKKGVPSYDIGRGLEAFYKEDSFEEMYPELKVIR